jgi:magnesium-transporting ATPase (P-type)
LTLVAAFGLNDELRDGVKDSIEKLEKGRITTRMLSGDNKHTAIAAALKAGILQEAEVNRENTCMLGEDFFRKIDGIKRQRKNGVEEWVPADMAEFKKVAQKLLVMARCTPEHKFAFIRGL